MLKFLKRQRHVLALAPFFLATVWFFVLERLFPVADYYIEMPLDDRIPFIPAFVIPYVAWYLYIAATLVFLYFAAPRDFVRLSLFLGAGMAVSCLIFTLIPNGQLLRPRRLDGDVFSQMVGTIYRSDTNTNSLPSIHVIYSLGVHFAIAQYSGLRGRFHPVKMVSLVLCVLICASTVAIKQHSILDVVAGVVVSIGLYAAFYSQRARALAHRYLLHFDERALQRELNQ
jgi:membrane-associated phospholipid phosphatase